MGIALYIQKNRLVQLLGGLEEPWLHFLIINLTVNKNIVLGLIRSVLHTLFRSIYKKKYTGP